MSTFRVLSGENRLSVYATRLGRTLEFKRGVYKTDDPAEVAVLRSNPLVVEAETPADVEAEGASE